MKASFEDLGWIDYRLFNEETRGICEDSPYSDLEDLKDEPMGIIQTTIIKLGE